MRETSRLVSQQIKLAIASSSEKVSFEQKNSLRTTLEINGCRSSHPGANSHPWPEEDGLCRENGSALFSDAPGARG